MQAEKVRVLVTAIGGGGHGEQILKALRLAGSDRYWILGGDANPSCPQFRQVDQHAVLPFANEPGYLDALFELIEKNRIKVLFHGCEPELKLFASHRLEIERRGVLLPINPSALIDTCMDKERTNALLERIGFEPPRFASFERISDLDAIDWYPVVLKPAVGGGGSANVFIVQSRQEMLGLADYLGLEENGIRFFVQEYVGTPDSEYTVGVLHDLDGRYINAIGIKRQLTGALTIRTSVPNRTHRRTLGPRLVISSGISQGKVGHYPEVLAQCRAIAAGIGAAGPINIQCRFVEGRVKVFEINPRFSGTTSLRAMAGFNEPDILIRRHLLGEPVQSDFAFRDCVILRRLVETEIG